MILLCPFVCSYQWREHEIYCVFIPPPTKLCGVYWFQHGYLSVRPSVCLFVEKWFLHDNSFSFWHTMMILRTCIDHDPMRTSIDLGVKRWKVKVVIFGLWAFYRFRTITLFAFGMKWWYFTHVLAMTRSIYFGVKRSKVKVIFGLELFTVFAWKLHFLLAYTYIDHDPRRTSIDFGVKRSQVNVIHCIWFSTFFMNQGGPILILGSRG